MIQRKQTVFYLISILALAIPMLGFALITFTKEQAADNDAIPWEQKITLFGNSGIEQAKMAGIDPIPSIPLYIINLLLIILLIVTILSYKNLKRQAFLGKISLWATLISIGVLLLALFNYYQYTRVLRPFMDLGLVLHFFAAAAIFILLGNRGVKKDQQLIASVDRIR